MPRYVYLIILFLILIIAIASCSKKSRLNPIDGDLGPYDTPYPSDEQTTDNLMSSENGVPMWIYSGTVNTRQGTARINQVRDLNAIGDMYDADISQFLKKNPCTDCVQLSGVGFDSGGEGMVLNFQIKHPFDDINKRPDLHVFDVRAIFQTDGNAGTMRVTGDLNGDGTRSPSETIKPGGNFITNADGWTTHFHSDQFTSNCHPFKRFFTNGSTSAFDPFNPVGYNVMKVGSGWQTQSFVIDTSLAPAHFDFNLIVDATYGQSAVFKTRSTPQYYLPAFNRKEAWSVEVSEISNNLEAGNISSSVDLEIRVKDWQAGAIVDSSFPGTDLSAVPYSSDVLQLIIDIPQVNSSSLDIETNTYSGNGSNSSPYIFHVTVNNDNGVVDGTYYGIAAIRDEIDTLEGPKGIPEGPSGYPESSVDIRDYTAYALFTVDVGEGSVIPPPTGDIEITGTDVVFMGQTVTLSATPATEGGSFSWTCYTSDVEIVGSANENTVQIRGVSPSGSIDVASVGVSYTNGTVVSDTYNMTCWGLEFVNPSGSDYRQYINLDGGGTHGRLISLQVEVQPSGMGSQQINWSFTDPDEPSQTQAADESSAYESDTTPNDNHGVEDPGFGVNYSGTNPNIYSSSTGSGTTADAPFMVSTYGGDNYIIKAYPTGVDSSLAIESPTITVWRWMDVPAFSMESDTGTDYYYDTFYSTVNSIYAGGYIFINVTREEGDLPYNSGGASNGELPLEATSYWPVENVPAINYMLSNSSATEGWHKVNMVGFRKFGYPSPINPDNVLGIAYSYWQVPEPDPFHFMYYNYFLVATGRIQALFGGSSDAAELHVFCHELGHTLGFPHNNTEEGDSGHDPFYPAQKWAGGLGIMAASVGTPVNNKFVRAELDFLRGSYGGPYFY